jgi:hypothetical protein
MTDAGTGPTSTAPQLIVVTVHGIRTYGQWQARLKDLIAGHGRTDVAVESFYYGYFSVIAFVVPVFRWLAVLFFRARLRSLFKQYPHASFAFVSHSFGTHLTVYGLQGLRRDEMPKITTIILAGSVIRPTFDWPKFFTRTGAGKVINDCGTGDFILILSQFGVLFTGMAGRIGFYGFSGAELTNRWFLGGHSHYFEPSHEDPDYFMRTYWLPIILDGKLDRVDQRPRLTAIGGLANAGIRLADPFKLAFYLALLWFGFSLLYLAPRLQVLAEQATREITVSTTLMETEARIPESIDALHRVLTRQQSVAPVYQRTAEEAVRFYSQRLARFGALFDRLPPGTVFRWGGRSYLAASTPLELPGRPVYFIYDKEAGRILALDSDSTVSVIDRPTGKVLHRQPLDEASGGTLGSVKFLRASAQPTHIGLEVSFAAPNNDDSTHYAVDVDLAAASLEVHGGFDERISFTATPDCSKLDIAADDYDFDDDPTPEQKEKREAKIARDEENSRKCLTVMTPQNPVPFQFPVLTQEGPNWSMEPRSVSAAADAASETRPCQFVSDSFELPNQVRTGVKLDLSMVPENTGDSLSREEIEGFFANPEFEEPCFVQFDGPTPRKFIANYGYIGQWHVSYAICELTSGDRVGSCVAPSYPWNGSGKVAQSPDKRFLVVAGYGNAGRPSWSLVDLPNMTALEPEIANDGLVSAIAFAPDADEVVVVSLVGGSPGAVRLQAFRIGKTIKLLASRVVEPSGSPEDLSETIPNPIENTLLLRTADGYTMATPYGDVIRFQITEDGAIPKVLDNILTGLGIPSLRQGSIALQWSATPLGFAPAGDIKFAVDPEHSRIAAFNKNSIRMMNLEQGIMLTSPVELSALGDCQGEISAVRLKPDGGIHVETPACVADRAPPPPLDSLLRAPEPRAAITPSDVDGQNRLPGEAKAQVAAAPSSETP